MSHNNTYINEAFNRLISAIIEYKRLTGEGITVVLGAGCSLSSSNTSITTESVMVNCILSYNSDYKYNGNWKELYQTFVNQCWDGVGHVHRMAQLKKQFNGLEPSMGYKYLAQLVKEGYVSDLITTNFDLLINKALQDLPYRLKVGESKIRYIGEGNKNLLFKIHGDIENGEQLRFSPDQLEKLPEEISSLIKERTYKPVLVIGFRGQDQGLMDSLHTSCDYEVFWATPNQPDKNDKYDNTKIYQWMQSRCSESNFLHGAKLGYFDNLMQNVVNCLNLGDTSILLEHNWRWSDFFITIKEHKKSYSLLIKLLEAMNYTFEHKYIWKLKAPFYAEDYLLLLKYTVNCIAQEKLPSQLLNDLHNNEIDCLMLVLAVEMNARLMGIDATVEEFVNDTESIFNSFQFHFSPDKNFWHILKSILNEDCDGIISDIDKISIQLNDSGRLYLTTQIGNIVDMSAIIIGLNIYSLFMPTCNHIDELDLNNITIHQIQKKDVSQEKAGNELIIRIASINQMYFLQLFENVRDRICRSAILENNIISGVGFRIISEQDEVSGKLTAANTAASLSQKLLEIEKVSRMRYINAKTLFEIDIDKYIKIDFSKRLLEFVESDQTAFFVVGSSGCGKTKTLQDFSRNKPANTIVIPVASKTFRIRKYEYGKINNAFRIFFNSIYTSGNIDHEDFLDNLNCLLTARNEKAVLIFDGLNEIEDDYDNIINLYIELIDFVDFVSVKKYKNIKVVISCRDNAFFQYKKSSGLEPNLPNWFVAPNQNDDYTSAYYRIAPLSWSEQQTFISSFCTNMYSAHRFKDLLAANIYLQKQFSSPYIIAVAGAVLNNLTISSEEINLSRIFSEFASYMLNRLNNEESKNIALKIITSYIKLTMLGKYANRRINSFMLTTDMPADTKKVHYVLAELRDIGIFTNDNDQYIRFTHDKIEEYFVGNILYEMRNPEYITKAIEFAKEDSVFQGGVIGFLETSVKEKDHFCFDCVKEYISSNPGINHDFLFFILFEGLKNTTGEAMEYFFSGLSDAEEDKILHFFLEGFEISISQKSTYIPENIFDIFGGILGDRSNILCIRLNYVEALYYIEIKNDYSHAWELCEQAIGALKSNKLRGMEDLPNKLLRLKALVKRQKGLLDDAQKILEDVFKEARTSVNTKAMIEIALDLCAIYREKSKYQDALEIYRLISSDICSVSSELKIRLYFQKGNVYKNILQQHIRNNNYDKALLEHLFSSAIECFGQCIYMLKENTNISYEISVYTEFAETCIVYSKRNDEELKRASDYLAMTERLLSYCPSSHRTIQFLRIKSRYIEQMGDTAEALRLAKNALRTAEAYKLSYRVFECHYLVGTLIWQHRVFFQEDTTVLQEGLDCLRNAITYCTDYGLEYLGVCEKRFEQLSTFAVSLTQ